MMAQKRRQGAPVTVMERDELDVREFAFRLLNLVLIVAGVFSVVMVAKSASQRGPPFMYAHGAHPD